MFIKAFSGGLKSSSKKGLLSAINELDDIADVNKLFKKSNISKKLASKLLDDSKFADALDKPYTKTASAAKEASSAVEKVAEASTSTATAVAEVGAATATSSASMTTMEAATAGLAAEETVATGATVGFGTAIKGFLVTVAPIAAALVAVGVAFKLAHDYVTKFDDAVEKAETSQSNFEQTKSELTSLQDELDSTKDKIKELKSSDKLTIADQAQLSTLKTQSKELQRQIDLKKKLADNQSQKAVKDAMSALKVGSFIDHTQTEDIEVSGGHGEISTTKKDTRYKRTDIVTAAKNEVKELNELKEDREKLLDDYDKAKTTKKKDDINEDIKAKEKEISKYEDTVEKKIQKIQKLRDNFLDENDNLKSGLNSKQQAMYNNQGSDDLGIEYVNPFGNYIENIDYFLNRKYLSSSTIIKYKLWKSDVDYYRNSYIECTRLYNKQYSQISELKNRVPLDDCSTDWSTFGDDKLQEAQENYKAQLKGYESYYVDENGDFDEEALKKSVDADDYYQIKNVILPSIQIEMDNRNLSSGQESTDYIDSYKTNWKLYGLDELDNKLAWYRKQKKLAEDEGCNIPYNDQSKHTENYHNKLYNKYTDAVNQLNPDYQGSCMEYYNKIKSEIDELTKLQDSYDKERKEIVKKLTKETWVHDIVTDSDGYIVDEVGNYITDENNNKIAYSITKCRFTYDEIAELNKIYIDGDYSNDNMFLTSSDDSVSAIDEQLKLLEAAEDDLYITSQPQYTYTTCLILSFHFLSYEHLCLRQVCHKEF